MSNLQLFSPSLSYFSCGTEITDKLSSEITLHNAGIQTVILTDNSKCNEPLSIFVVVFDEITVAQPFNEVKFSLIDTRSNELIVSAVILYALSNEGTYEQVVQDITNNWTGNIDPSTTQLTPEGSLKLISFSKDILYFDFKVENDVFKIKNIGYYIVLEKEITNNSTNLSSVFSYNNNSCIFKSKNNTLILQIYTNTDSWGLNIQQMSGIVTANKKYPNGYPDELIGYCNNLPNQRLNEIQTLYNFNPNIRKVLKLDGETLLNQTININKKYNNINDKPQNCDFFIKIITYSSLRYYLGGLSDNGNFSCKWLYANNYKKFLINLKNSEFNEALIIFTDPAFGFVDFNKYFRNCKCKSKNIDTI